MISFYPGPSRVHDAIPAWTKDAHKRGILSMSHRSKEFIKLSSKTIALLKQKLKIPKDYTIFFTSSATECWEIIAQSIVTTKSFHIYNGAFGEKWYDYTHRLRPEAVSLPFNPEKELNPKDFIFPDGDLICLTQNETSNGTQVSNATITAIQENNPDHLISVDATSSMAGVYLDFKSADIWFASVQKCFGLPAGLAVMACSPNAIRKMETLGEQSHYNSLSFMNSMMDKWQTPFTPNVLGIYLLMRSLEKMKSIRRTDHRLVKRFKKWENFFERSTTLRPFISNPSTRSFTVFTVAATPKMVDQIKIDAKKKGLLLGEGYGDLKSKTFRIANFPALKKKEIEKLVRFLTPYR